MVDCAVYRNKIKTKALSELFLKCATFRLTYQTSDELVYLNLLAQSLSCVACMKREEPDAVKSLDGTSSAKNVPVDETVNFFPWIVSTEQYRFRVSD